jgi:hypothetical protein
MLLGAVLVSLTLAACGNSEVAKIKDTVRQNLKDPDSAKFGTVLMTSDATIACIEFNAKNSMGGYVGMRIAQLTKKNGVWEVLIMDQYPSNCHGTTVD